jgi:hypothetical protein
MSNRTGGIRMVQNELPRRKPAHGGRHRPKVPKHSRSRTPRATGNQHRPILTGTCRSCAENPYHVTCILNVQLNRVFETARLKDEHRWIGKKEAVVGKQRLRGKRKGIFMYPMLLQIKCQIYASHAMSTHLQKFYIVIPTSSSPAHGLRKTNRSFAGK